ncbi:MAG: hypothetical protein ACJ8CB_36015 [Ktedonobacteraceae bacterium]
MEPAKLEDTLNLTTAKATGYSDNRTCLPKKIRLDGFVYDAIYGASAKERLKWLLLNESGYSPQIYAQLAAVYRAGGHEENARSVLIARQSQRFAQRNLL